jgi:hypothetical protein
MKLRIDTDALRPIVEPHIRITWQPVTACDGGECGSSRFDEAGNQLHLPPHLHLILSDPDGGSITFAMACNDLEGWQI